MRIERHIFGSVSGYTTLAASAGITSEEARQFEATAFMFGQSFDRGYSRSLHKSPAWFTHALRGGRRALTRVLEGRPDDNGRGTHLLITAVVSQRDWDNELLGDVRPLLDDPMLWEWDHVTSRLPPIELPEVRPQPSVPRRSVDRLLGLVSQVETAMAARQRIAIAESEFTLADLAALEMLIPPSARGQFTSGFRTLSPALPVTVNCLSSAAVNQPISYRPDGAAALSPYARWLKDAGLAEGLLPIEQIATYRGFATVKSSSRGGEAPGVTLAPPAVQVIHRTPRWPWAVAAALALLLGIGGYLVGSLRARTAAVPTTQPVAPASAPPPVQEPTTRPVEEELRNQLAAIESRLREMQAELVQKENQIQSLTDQRGRLSKTVEGLIADLAKARAASTQPAGGDDAMTAPTTQTAKVGEGS